MQLTDKQITEFQDLFEKEYGKKMSRQEATESAHNLINFMELMFKLAHKEKLRNDRLEKEPKGFHIEGQGYSCAVCGTSVSDNETWYDKHGIKCLICQKAINQKKIPGFVCKDKDSWYSGWELKEYYGIRHAQAQKLIREGALKARIVMGSNRKPYFYLYLLKDNPGVLQPKPKPVMERVGERGISMSLEQPKLVLGNKTSLKSELNK